MSTSVPTAKLAEVAELNPPLAAALGDADDVAFMPMAAVDADSLTASDSETRPYREARKGYTPFLDGDLLVAKITPCFENGKIAQARISRPHGFGSTEFHVVRPRSDRADARYLLHYLRQDRIRKQGESRMTGSAGQRRVPEHFLAGLTIPLPPLAEQRRLAEILDKADMLRATRRAALAQLGALHQSILIDMFGDPATNPKGWARTTLGEQITVGPQNGLYKPSEDYGSGTPIVRIDAFYDGAITNIASLKRVRVSTQEQELYGLREGEILINRVNSREYLGKCALVPPLREATVFESNMMRFDVCREVLEPAYLIEYLQTSLVRAHVNKSAKDAINQSSINQRDVKAVPLLVPPIVEQRLFVQRAAAADRLVAAHDASSAIMNALFASLEHRAFHGEL